MRRGRVSIGVLLLATLALLPLARAQEPPRPEEKKPEEKKPEGEIPIISQEELDRVRAELARIEAERKRLAVTSADLEERRRELERQAAGLSTNPVLNPRREVQAVTIRGVIASALVNNADLLVEALAAESAQEGPEIEEGPFDPVVKSTGQWQDSRAPNFTNNPFTGLPSGRLTASVSKGWSFQTSVEKRFVTGTNVRVEYDDGYSRNNSTFSINPTYSPKLRLELSQNLLKGFFAHPLDVNNARIRAAEDDAGAADALYAQRLMEAVLQVEQAYWDVVRAEEDLKVSESSLKSALELLSDQRKRKALGAATALEVTIAEAGVAQRRESVIVSENKLESSRDVLVKLSEPVSRPNRYDLFLVPIDRAELVPTPEPDVQRAIQTALARRPDYRRAQLQVDSAKQQLISAENNVLPSLDAFSFLEEDGVGRSSRGAWSAAGEGHFYTAGGGLRIQFPLFLRSERAQARKARIEQQRAEAALEALESDVVLEVRKAVRDIRTARARIDASMAARILSEKQLEAMKSQVRFGTAVPRQVLDLQTDLDQAKRNEIQAHIDFRVSLTTLEKAMGTILDPYADKLRPRVRRAFATSR
ncbi:TolC family protein [bacterium]|nr:TolC family protein [bacterium]